MKASLDLNVAQFLRTLGKALEGVTLGAEEATRHACQTVEKMTLEQVPKDTKALASSFEYQIEKYGDGFVATLGYGLNGDPVNFKTGKRASEYMLEVHEDLEMPHREGKAKFFEDPLREYQEKFLPDVVNIVRDSIERST